MTKPDTHLAHGGRDPAANHGIVNPPVYHASTVLFPTLDALEARTRDRFRGVYYGRFGTPTSFALEHAVAELEGGHGAVTAPSGLAAITTALLGFTGAGDHILVTDSVYSPTRDFCDHMLARNGVTVEYIDPRCGAAIGDRLRPETSVVFLESPGSLTFELQDVPAIAAVVRAKPGRPATIMVDNTWASPLYCRPLALGADISIHAATKYIVGHSDAMLGLIVCNEASYDTIRRAAVRLGTCAGPDDVWLGLRGLRTLSVRLARHWQSGLVLAEWLAGQPEVVRVIHPARPDHPDHALWQRDFTGASGLFAIVLDAIPRPALAALVDGLRLFGIGYSWGGFESLILPADPAKVRSATDWQAPGPLVRLHAGLEDVGDLIGDLEAGFARLRTVGR